MKKMFPALLWSCLTVLIALRPGAESAWCQTNPVEEMFKTITALELQVKIVMKDDTFTNSDFYDEYTGEHREHGELRDKLNVTIEGMFRFKPYELQVTPPLGWPPGVPYPPVGGYCPPGVTCPPTTPTYPRGPLLIPDEVNTPTPTISGSGNGDSSHWSLVEHCKPPDLWPCQDFKQEGTENWQYKTVDSAYAIGRPIENVQLGLVRDLLVRQQSANAPVSYTFDLRPAGIGDYVKGSGTGTTTTRSYTTNETTSYTLTEFGADIGRSWTEFVAQNGNSKITGGLTIANGQASASGHLTHNYDYTSADGDRETGTAEVYYTIRAILSTDQAIDQTEFGCPDGKCKGSRGSSGSCSGYGAPAWNVNMANLNIFITDTPLWYRSPIGPPVEVKLSYNSRAPETRFEPVGRKWQLNYESFLSADQATGDVTIYMPDGKRDVYTYTPAGFTAPYRVFNDLRITRQGGLFDGNDYELTFPDGTVYVYKVPDWSYRWAFLSEIRDRHLPVSNKLTLHWEGLFPFGAVLKQVTDALGRATVFTHDDNNRIKTISDPFGRTAFLDYDPLGRLMKITDMGGYATTFVYSEGVLADDYSLIRRMVQGNNIWEFTPDSTGLTVTDNMGTERFVLNADQGIASFQGANATAGETYVYKLAPAQDGSKYKDVTGLETPEGVSFDLTYDQKGNLLTDTLKSLTGDETAAFTYNAKGKVTSVRDAKGTVTLLTYASNNVDLEKLEDGLGSINATYNGNHDIETIIDRLGNTTRFTANEYGHLTQTTDALGIQTTFIYDDIHQLIRIERAGTVIGRYTYDRIGRVESYTDASGLTKIYAYNDLDDLLSITYPDGTATTFSRQEPVPHQIDGVTDQAGQTTQHKYNARGNLREIVDPEQGRTQLFYYPAGNLREIIDPNLNSTRFEYDRDSRLTRKIFSNGSQVRYDYARGRLIRLTNARGTTSEFTYDKNGNVRTIVYSDGTPGVIRTYDDHDRLIRIDDGLGVHLMTYDAESRVKSIDGPWANDTLTFEYDVLGRRTLVAPETGSAVTYGYDSLNRLTAVSGSGLAYAYAYLGGSKLLERLSRSDGSRTDYAYDPVMKRLERYVNRKGTGEILNEYSFTYDALGRVTNETVTNGPPLEFGKIGETAQTYNNLNQAATVNGSDSVFTYDADGNMTRGLTGDGRAFEAVYDAENRMTSIQYSDGAGILQRRVYVYGADGSVGIEKRYAGADLTGERRFVRHGGMVLQERNGGNNVERGYLWGIGRPGGVGALLALTQAGQAYHYFSNTRGDITAVLDGAGAIGAAYAYDPFGMPLADTGTLKQPMRFSTKPYDEGTGLYDYGSRFYSPSLGRWLARDPLAEKASINLYAFVGNDPVNGYDPNGLDMCQTGREWSAAEVQSRFLDKAVEKYSGMPAEKALAGFTCQSGNICGPGGGKYDFKENMHKYDTFDVPGIGKMNAGQFGNYFAGYVTGIFGEVGEGYTKFGGQVWSLLDFHSFDDAFDQELISRGAYDYKQRYGEPKKINWLDRAKKLTCESYPGLCN